MTCKAIDACGRALRLAALCVQVRVVHRQIGIMTTVSYAFVVLPLSCTGTGEHLLMNDSASKSCSVLDCLLLCLQDSFAELKVKEIKNGR